MTLGIFDDLGNNPTPSPVYPYDPIPESIMQEAQSEHFIEANRFAKWHERRHKKSRIEMAWMEIPYRFGTKLSAFLLPGALQAQLPSAALKATAPTMSATLGLGTKEETEENSSCDSSFVLGKNIFWTKNMFGFFATFVNFITLLFSYRVLFLYHKRLGWGDFVKSGT